MNGRILAWSVNDKRVTTSRVELDVFRQRLEAPHVTQNIERNYNARR
jgi:hypothetical protein